MTKEIIIEPCEIQNYIARCKAYLDAANQLINGQNYVSDDNHLYPVAPKLLLLCHALELTLKILLSNHGVKYKNNHNIEELYNECIKHSPTESFPENIGKLARIFKGYHLESRYPTKAINKKNYNDISFYSSDSEENFIPWFDQTYKTINTLFVYVSKFSQQNLCRAA